MHHILRLLDQGEIIHLLLVVVLLNCIGSRLAEARTKTLTGGGGGLVFLAYLLNRFLTDAPSGSDEFLDLIVRGLLAGGIVFGLALFALPLLEIMYDRLWIAPWRAARRAATTVSHRLRQKPVIPQTPLSAPDQARLREQSERLAREQAEASRRRADARAKAEIFYVLHRPEIEGRVSEAMLTDFFQRHMNDAFPPDYVEERGRQLLDILQRHLDKVVPPISTQSFEEILKSFDDRMRRIREGALDERDKEILLLQLDEEREGAVRKAIREGRL